MKKIRTIKWKKYLWKKKYDLFITDDLLGINGKLRNIPTILFQDDDIEVVPETIILQKFSTDILSPYLIDLCSLQSKWSNYPGILRFGLSGLSGFVVQD